MPADVIIRPEHEGDFAAIGAIIRAAFHGKPYAAGDEAELVETLRWENALTLSLVAELAGTVLGQIAFSPARMADGTQQWYALGPAAVLPACQGQGIGARLVRAGLHKVSELGGDGCILTGDPAYYVRFGFEHSPENAPVGESAEHFMIKRLGHRQPVGPIAFHPAFTRPATGGGAVTGQES